VVKEATERPVKVWGSADTIGAAVDHFVLAAAGCVQPSQGLAWVELQEVHTHLQHLLRCDCRIASACILIESCVLVVFVVMSPCVQERLVAMRGKLVTLKEQAGEAPNGTQFMITTGPTPELDTTNLIVGKVSCTSCCTTFEKYHEVLTRFYYHAQHSKLQQLVGSLKGPCPRHLLVLCKPVAQQQQVDA